MRVGNRLCKEVGRGGSERERERERNAVLKRKKSNIKQGQKFRKNY